jgi:hypothetical protein
VREAGQSVEQRPALRGAPTNIRYGVGPAAQPDLVMHGKHLANPSRRTRRHFAERPDVPIIRRQDDLPVRRVYLGMLDKQFDEALVEGLFCRPVTPFPGGDIHHNLGAANTEVVRIIDQFPRGHIRRSGESDHRLAPRKLRAAHVDAVGDSAYVLGLAFGVRMRTSGMIWLLRCEGGLYFTSFGVHWRR